MVNYYQYLPVSSEDESWGLSVLNTGCTHIKAGDQYPYKEHPSHHYFTWETGRILNEFQLIYITAGEGVFQSTSMAETVIQPGTIIFLFPGEWHRFQPKTGTGWNEYWVGFKGKIIEHIQKQYFFHPKHAVIHVGCKEEIIILFNEILEQTKKERPGYQPLISGAVLHLLGQVHAFNKQKIFENEVSAEIMMNRAMLLLRTRIDEDLAMQQIAMELKVSYAWFRKMFKLYTGIAPQQYFIQLKIERAKTLLNDPDKTIKDIAYELNFENPLYFSKLFKDKVGVSPEQFKKRYSKE
ncbi:MAG: AraC family transcriptional regulator [Sediminibacterium sp.]|nr:AraC family transcriptional regulator [Sediminibacterium sp.]